MGGVASRAAGVLVALFMLQAWGSVLAIGLFVLVREASPAVDGLVWAVVAGAAGIGGLGCMFLALSRSAMGLVSALAALTGAALPAVVGVFNGDPMNAVLGLGMAVALVAIVVISLPEGLGGRPTVPAFHGSRPVEWLLIVGAGVGSATFFLTTDRAHEAGMGTATTLMAVRLTSFGLVSMALLVAWLRARRPGRRPVRIGRLAVVLGLVAAVGDTFGTVTYLGAVAAGTLSVTVVLVSLYPVSTTLLARMVLHERLSRVRVAGVGMAVLGAALMGLGASAGG